MFVIIMLKDIMTILTIINLLLEIGNKIKDFKESSLKSNPNPLPKQFHRSVNPSHSYLRLDYSKFFVCRQMNKS